MNNYNTNVTILHHNLVWINKKTDIFNIKLLNFCYLAPNKNKFFSGKPFFILCTLTRLHKTHAQKAALLWWNCQLPCIYQSQWNEIHCSKEFTVSIILQWIENCLSENIITKKIRLIIIRTILYINHQY